MAIVSSNDGATSVTLVHGLWMNAIAMYPLHLRVQRCGFNVNRFGYASMRCGLDENAAQLSRHIEAIEAEDVHLIAHSLGGLVTMRALQLQPDPRVRRVVLLGSPIAGSLSGRRLGRSAAGRLLLGKSVGIWETSSDWTFPDGVATGVIAGSMPIGLGRLVGQRCADPAVAAAGIVVAVTETDDLFVVFVADPLAAAVG